MTKDELLALGLTNEQADAINADIGKNYVAKSQFNQKNEELKQVKGELETVKGEVDTLKKDHADNESLTKQIQSMQKAAEEREKSHKAELKRMELDAMVDMALVTAKARNPKAVRALLNLEKAKVEDGKVVGLEDQLKALSESDSYLFDTGTKQIAGVTPGESNTNTTGAITAKDFARMTYAERTQLYAENKELYNNLANNGGNENG